MKMRPLLSVCITAYNQSGFIKKGLDIISNYSGEDIELVLQDDCSVEDIGQLVAERNDKRIKYYRNEQNLGHDYNIIQGFEHCSGRFVLLLRSSDYLIPERIEDILSFLQLNQDIGYCRFSCIDERGNIRIQYEDIIYKCGEESILANKELLIHPSGEIYNLSLFSPEVYNILKEYLDDYFDNNLRFIVHVLMRDYIACKASIATNKIVAWQYTYTIKRRDVAENRSNNKKSVYSPYYLYQRFNCELSYIVNELGPIDYQMKLIDNTIDKYARAVTIGFERINMNKKMQTHYDFDQERFSPFKEIDLFVKKTKQFAAKYDYKYNHHIGEVLKKYNKRTIIKWECADYIRRIKNRIQRSIRQVVAILTIAE